MSQRTNWLDVLLAATPENSPCRIEVVMPWDCRCIIHKENATPSWADAKPKTATLEIVRIAGKRYHMQAELGGRVTEAAYSAFPCGCGHAIMALRKLEKLAMQDAGITEEEPC